MRLKLLATLVLVLAVQPAIARADGPAGSKETRNSVKCGDGTDTPVGRLYAAPNGIELCSDDNSNPDGRIIVSSDGYIAVDGDKDNGQASRFARLDSSGPSCSDASHTDSTAGSGGACGALAGSSDGLAADLTQLALQVMHLVA